MFGVLGSLMFWVVFIPIDFIIAIIVMKIAAPNFLLPFTENTSVFDDYEADAGSYIGAIMMILMFMVFWWTIVLLLIIWKIGELIFPSFVAIVKKVINTIPTITITNKEK